APAALGPPGRPAPHPTTRPPASRPAEYEELLYRRGGTRDALIPPESPKRDAPAADRAPRAAPHGHAGSTSGLYTGRRHAWGRRCGPTPLRQLEACLSRSPPDSSWTAA